MDLIVGTRRITPSAIERIDGGVEATLRGEALIRVLDAGFRGLGTIEVLGAGLDRRPMDVAAVEMTGGETRVTLLCAGPARALV